MIQASTHVSCSYSCDRGPEILMVSTFRGRFDETVSRGHNRRERGTYRYSYIILIVVYGCQMDCILTLMLPPLRPPSAGPHLCPDSDGMRHEASVRAEEDQAPHQLARPGRVLFEPAYGRLCFYRNVDVFG